MFYVNVQEDSNSQLQHSVRTSSSSGSSSNEVGRVAGTGEDSQVMLCGDQDSAVTCRGTLSAVLWYKENNIVSHGGEKMESCRRSVLTTQLLRLHHHCPLNAALMVKILLHQQRRPVMRQAQTWCTRARVGKGKRASCSGKSETTPTPTTCTKGLSSTASLSHLEHVLHTRCWIRKETLLAGCARALSFDTPLAAM